MNALATTTKYPELPSAKEASLAKEAGQLLASFVDGDSDVNITVDRGEANIQATLPASALEMLVEMLAYMSQGNAVTFIPTGHELTTQQAAHFLNVSRPYLIGLLEDNKIPFYKVGRHRRIKFEDLRDYKEKRDTEQNRALDDLTAVSQKLAAKMGEEY